ncbi:Smr domain-containing protein [Lachnellula occidentalis]|uniref:Smr domain-containing protein n=1 Tax=Lachnellula occidentalis TaxID=215460 RepID=A0A8H8UGC4_9HELO|nr:Smr domain-containing protein [Lachnellula occidentalis]
MSDVEGLATQLLEEYSKAIDSSTVLAILSDFDLNDLDQLNAAKETLEIVKATVPDDEASGFDASAASGPQILIGGLGEAGENESQSGSGQSAPGWTSQTDDSSLGHEMTSLDLESLEFTTDGVSTPTDESTDTPYASQLDDLDEERKEIALMGIFPTLNTYDVKWTLKKYNGNASLAIDELMNESFLEENGLRHKGIDAFSESDTPSRPRKNKARNKKRKGRMTEDDANTSVPDLPVQSKWETASHDVDFIATRTGMPNHQVGSMYHKSGGSLQGTLVALIEAHKDLNIEDDDPMIQINASELHERFPSTQIADLEALVQLAHPSIAYASDLAKALSSRPHGSQTPIQIQLRHAPINLNSDPSTPFSSAKPKFNPALDLDPISANAITSTYTTARNAAFSQASAYYRKGKSDHLMGGAAAYYSQEGRSYQALAKSAESDAADALVSSQSKSGYLDLHGVSVKDAV